jgi:hypothetical protein
MPPHLRPLRAPAQEAVKEHRLISDHGSNGLATSGFRQAMAKAFVRVSLLWALAMVFLAQRGLEFQPPRGQSAW